MALCLIKHKDNFTFAMHFKKPHFALRNTMREEGKHIERGDQKNTQYEAGGMPE
jgi:hypothetical protein